MEFEVKIIRIGNSVGFIIPKPILKSLGWKAGDPVAFKYNPKTGDILVTKKK